ncbi:MAG: thymidylate synthase [Patescibacteria group bacterium]
MEVAWPIYFKDRLLVGDFDSSVGVATLWMPKESVAEVLDGGSSKELGRLYSVCGQLYTKRGINPLLRNILANPKIRHLVICGPDRQGSGEALLKFFKSGIDLKTRKVVGDDEAIIDKEIPIKALELLRRSVFVHNMIMRPLEEVRDFVQKLPSEKPFGKPQVFSEEKVALKTGFPSDLSVFKIRRDYIGDAWLDVLKTIVRFGVDTPGMYGKVKQVQNLSVVIEKESTKSPKIELYLNFNSKSLNKYYKGFFSNNGDGSESYTYGERIFNWGDGVDQQKIMAEKLKRFPYDRGAVAVLWETQNDNFPPKGQNQKEGGQTKGWKVPCLVMLLAQCMGEELYMTAIFRNNDMYGAWPLNAFALRKFQEELAQQVGKNVGSLTTISHIAEIYEADWVPASLVIEKNDSLSRTCIYDPRSYYTIKVVGKEIIAEFLSPNGATPLTTLKIDGKKPKAARGLCATAIKEMLISDLGAACDFGRQLAKAEAAVKLRLHFEQDRPLKSI